MINPIQCNEVDNGLRAPIVFLLKSSLYIFMIYLFFIFLSSFLHYTQDLSVYYLFLSSFLLGLFYLYDLSFYVLQFIFLSLFLLVSIKMFLDISIIIGNVIDIYVYGIVAICMNGYVYAYYCGFMIFNFMWYYSILSVDIYLFVMSLIELFSLLFQSLTLSNRITINIVAGGLLIYLLSLLLSIHFLLIIPFAILFVYEYVNLLFQVFIFIF